MTVPDLQTAGESIRGFGTLSAGGDILFHEACRAFGIDTVIVLPFSPDEVFETSVEYAGAQWRNRFLHLRQTTPQTRRYELGLSDAASPYAILYRKIFALAQNEGTVRLIALWNGNTEDGPGGTYHVVNFVRRNSGQIEIIDTNQLFR
jgi:hypothetical protein